jgi:hypothetical protein
VVDTKIGLTIYLLKPDKVAAFEGELKPGRDVRPLAISAVTSAEEVEVLVGFSGDCGAGCFAIATAATRVKARLIIILRMKPPSVLRLASASYASPALDTTICRRNQGEPDPPLIHGAYRKVAQSPAG